VPVEGTPLRPGNCADCGDALETARQTYCRDCADRRRRTSNAEADRRRRQADRDRRTRPASAQPDGSLVLPPDTVRLFALQVEALREAVDAWTDNLDRLSDLQEESPEDGDTDTPEFLADLHQVQDADLELTEATANAAFRFLAAVGNLLPGPALGS